MSDTPRTDAAIVDVLDEEATRKAGSQVTAVCKRWVEPEFARGLERELTAAMSIKASVTALADKEIAELKSELQTSAELLLDCTRKAKKGADELRDLKSDVAHRTRNMHELARQANELAEALRQALNPPPDWHPDKGWHALAKFKEGR